MKVKPLLGCVLAATLGGVAALALARVARTPAQTPDRGTALEKTPALAPEFPKGVTWLQSKPLKLADLRGRVVVVHFWTFGCINCIHNYPVYKAWQEKYAGKDVTVIGVHTPEFRHEADETRVRAKARDNGLKFPIVMDNASQIWKAWANRYWPSIYLIDKQGRVRYHWDGELHLQDAQAKRFAAHINELLAEPSPRTGPTGETGGK